MNTLHKFRTLSLGLLSFALVACGGGGGGGGGATNNPPQVNAGANFSVSVGAEVTLAGSATDSDGDTLSYSWSLTGTPAGSSVSLNNSGQLNATFTPDLAGAYTADLMASDGTDQASSSVIVTVTQTGSSNTPPVVNAGSNFTVEVGTVANLSGSASDSDGDALNYTWSFTSTPSGSTANLTTPSELGTAFTPNLTGTYTVSLMVSDGTDQVSNTVTVTAVPANDPYNGGTYNGGTVPPAQVGATVVGLTIEELSGSNQTSVPVTFGQIFAPGEIPTGSLIAVRLADGSQNLLPSQVNKKATHADGSLRHAVITTRLPTLVANSQQGIEIVVVDAVSTAASVQLADLLTTNFTGQVSLTVSGTTYTASIVDLLNTTQSQTWLSGSEVSEWMVTAPFKTAGGTEHPHLTARFNVRAFASFDSVRVDVTVENNWAYVTAPQNFVYDTTVSICGNNVYSKTGLTHYHHARWRKTFWCGNEPAIHVKHDTDYLIDSNAIPNYDRNMVIPESDLASMEVSFTGSKTEPNGIGLASAYMPGTGAHVDIGPIPRWSIRYLLSQDKRAKDAMLGTDNLAGSWSTHYRDKNTGRPILLSDYPYMTVIGNASDTQNPATGQYESFPTCGGDCSTPYEHDLAHQPSFAYMSYLVSGDQYYLEELQFWANYNLLQSNPHYRGFEKGLFKSGQLRGQAWSLRTLGQAAYITPDINTLKGYFVDRLSDNLTYYKDSYIGGVKDNALGVITDGYSVVYNSDRGTATWQEAFFTWSSGYLVELGFTEAQPLLNWKATFPVSLMTDSGFCWIYASSYYLNVRDSSSNAIYSTFAEVYQASISDDLTTCQNSNSAPGQAVGEMVGYASEPTGYPANIQPALAVSTISNQANSLDAWAKFDNRTVKPNYSSFPNFAVIPR